MKMQAQLLFLVSFASVLLINAGAQPTKTVCEPGAFFKLECNECKCSADGADMVCTRQICAESAKSDVKDAEGQDPTEGEKVREARSGAEEATEEKAGAQTPEDDEAKDMCTPGRTFKRDCNDCTCPPSGKRSEGVCTLLACADAVKSEEPRP